MLSELQRLRLYPPNKRRNSSQWSHGRTASLGRKKMSPLRCMFLISSQNQNNNSRFLLAPISRSKFMFPKSLKVCKQYNSKSQTSENHCLKLGSVMFKTTITLKRISRKNWNTWNQDSLRTTTMLQMTPRAMTTISKNSSIMLEL